ncbi:MAG: hypothetical protein MR598_08675 [Erysipelotrichaceae bacterium]|nr:hypothetical protein [Erysipelotrichaceae bacterium]
MKEQMKGSHLVSIFLIFFIIIGLIAGLFYFNIKKHASITVEAVVKYIGNDYIVVEDENQEEYSLKTEEDYNVGDKVSFVIKDIKKDSNPKEGTVEKIDTISKSVHFVIMDNNNKENDETTTSNDETTTEAENKNATQQDTTSNASIETEDSVVTYFEQLNKDIDRYNQNRSLGQTIKKGFVTAIDFLFYGGTIKGYTFDSLSNKAKLKVLKLAFSIDSKIEKYFPGYKEEISTTSSKIYTNVKAKAIEAYLDITTKVCQEQSDTCHTAKEGLADLKKSFSLTWDFIKDISGVGISKLKAWYEVWKETE